MSRPQKAKPVAKPKIAVGDRVIFENDRLTFGGKLLTFGDEGTADATVISLRTNGGLRLCKLSYTNPLQKLIRPEEVDIRVLKKVN